MVTVSDGRGGGGKGMQLGMGNAARPPSDAAPIAGPPGRWQGRVGGCRGRGVRRPMSPPPVTPAPILRI